jgi:very-short-patch-repair endonuclease
METRLRLLLIDGGLPEPTLQHPVTTPSGRFRLDLSWPSALIAVEYDGFQFHADHVAFARDRRRWRALVAAGWDVHPVTALDLRQPAALVTAVGDALRRRATATDPSRRGP